MFMSNGDLGQSDYGNARGRESEFRHAGLSSFELNVYMLTSGNGDGTIYDIGIVARVMKSPEVEIIEARDSALTKLDEL
jgi:hypothetical protein